MLSAVALQDVLANARLKEEVKEFIEEELAKRKLLGAQQ
jgi:hypothetical protein